MLDYYFCEECQTYHQPNRLINGEYLTACECEVSTQNETSDSHNGKSTQTLNLSRRTNTDTNTVYNSYESPPFDRHYLQTPRSPTIQQNHSNIRIANSVTRYNNMPFMSIINDENKQQMKKIIVRQQNQRHSSPIAITRQVPIRKSVSPVYKTQQVPAAPVSAYRSIPVQAIQPKRLTKIQHQNVTPIETIQRIAYNTSRSISPPSTMVSIPVIQQAPLIIRSQPQMNLLPPSPRPSIEQIRYSQPQIMEQINKKVERITLDRVSGQPQAQQLSQSQRQYEGNLMNRFSLDRVTQTNNNNIIQEGQEDNQCCGTLCYH